MELKRGIVVVPLLLLMVELLGNSMSKVRAVFDAPAQYDGFFYPKPLTTSLPILLEAVNDPMCPDSKAAWPVIKEIVQFYGSNLTLVIHEFPVPFHRNSFIATRALHIANTLNPSLTVPYLELMYENQASLSTNATYSLTPENVTQTIIGLAVQVGLPRHEMSESFSDPNTDYASRASFKYICSRSITSTPSYLINGAPMPADQTWTVDRWKKYLGPLFASI